MSISADEVLSLKERYNSAPEIVKNKIMTEAAHWQEERRQKTALREKAKSDFGWFGRVQEISSVGKEYAIVELLKKDPSSKEDTNERIFTAYVNGERLLSTYPSFDAALAGAIAFKHEGCNHRADRYFIRMLSL